MSDSVDRVFNHALNTVNKIRTGAQKPPAATRLKLYGLYKQAMEGDPTSLLPRPTGKSADSQRHREKYDAWHSCAGLSRTEAKRRYISALIDTMHQYAVPTPETQALVSELEFVWDQIKDNSNPGSSGGGSSPLADRSFGASGILDGGGNWREDYGRESREDLGRLDADAGSGVVQRSDGDRQGRALQRKEVPPMRVLSPMSESQAGELDEDEDAEFVDAVDSLADEDRDLKGSGMGNIASRLAKEKSKSRDDLSWRKRSAEQGQADPGDGRWRKRMEGALVKLTAEVAALREQLESRKLFSRGRKHSFFAWVSWLVWGVVKWVGLNVVVLCIVLAWMRRKQDRRLEMAVRLLLGDAIDEVKRRGAEGMKNFQRMQVPVRLPVGKPRGER